MHHIVTSLRPCCSHLQEAVATAAGRLFTFEAPQIGFLAFKKPTGALGTMQTALKSSKARSKSPQLETSEPKPDTPDDVDTPEVREGAAPVDDGSDFNAREGGEGGPGKIPMKKQSENKKNRQGQGKVKEEGGSGHEHMQKRRQQGDEQNKTMGPDTVGDTHRLDYSR
jgi:hypothetical protein